MALPVITPLERVIAFATAWGPKQGGINAFNTELLKSLGVSVERSFEVTCVVSEASSEEIAEAKRFSVELLSLGRSLSGNVAGNSDVFEKCAAALAAKSQNACWIGHDLITGPMACEMRDRFAGRVCLFHHAAYGRYQGFKHLDSSIPESLENRQRSLFQRADRVLAVGPLLADNLAALLKDEDNQELCFMPGLPDIDPAALPSMFTMFVAGRLHPDDEPIKQGKLALAALGMAVKEAHKKAGLSPTLKNKPALVMLGVEASLEMSLRELYEQYAGRQDVLKLLPFTHNAAEYAERLAGSSLVLMPSWHDGFGLVAWEAIGAGVPVIVGKDTGVSQFFRAPQCKFRSEDCVMHLDVRGDLVGESRFNADDLEEAKDLILNCAARIKEYRIGAQRLRDQLRLSGFGWDGRARDFIRLLNLPKRIEAAAKDRRDPIADVPGQRDWLQLETVPIGGLQTSAELLRAQTRAVPFDQARSPDLEKLLSWANQDHGEAVTLVHAAGGMGKTRLAIEMCLRLAECGWRSGFALSASNTVVAARLRAAIVQPNPILVVLDYADHRSDEVVAIIQTMLAVGNKSKCRILLLARNADDWWNVLCSNALVGAFLAGPKTELLGLQPLPDDLSTRQNSYVTAYTAYAGILKIDQRPRYLPELQAPHYGRPLFVHLAALAAIRGERPETAKGLLRTLALRETTFWDVKGIQELDVIRYNISLITLIGGTTDSEESRMLIRRGGYDPDNAAYDVLHRLYPHGLGIAAIEPDLLGEFFILEELQKPNASKFLAAALSAKNGETIQRAALAKLGRILESSEDLDDEQIIGAGLGACMSNSFVNLTMDAAISSGPGLGNALAYAFTRLPRLQQTQIARSVELPEETTALREFCAAVSDVRVTYAVGPTARARALHVLSIRLAEVDRAEDVERVIKCSRAAVSIMRGLTRTQRSTYILSLANCLSSLGARLASQGGKENLVEALRCTQEAVSLHREDALKTSEGISLELAGSLNNLSNRLASFGDSENLNEALVHAREAVDVARKLAQKTPAVSSGRLASVLGTLSNRLDDVGGEENLIEAVDCAKEAVDIFQLLVEERPDAFRLHLARALTMWSSRVGSLGGIENERNAIAHAEEALGIRRKYARSRPEIGLPELSSALGNLSSLLARSKKPDLLRQAIDYAREGVRLSRTAAKKRPTTHLPELAGALQNLSSLLSKTNDSRNTVEAISIADEAVLILRPFARDQPDIYRSRLATCLFWLGHNYCASGSSNHVDSAISAADEAVEIFRQLSTSRPEAFLPDLGETLASRAGHLRKKGNTKLQNDARKDAIEALQILIPLYSIAPDRHSESLESAVEAFIEIEVWSGIPREKAAENLKKLGVPNSLFVKLEKLMRAQ